MTDREPLPRRPSVLRFTRMMEAPLRRQFPVPAGPDESAEAFMDLLEQADHRRGMNEKTRETDAP